MDHLSIFDKWDPGPPPPLKFKSGTPEPQSEFESATPGPR